MTEQTLEQKLVEVVSQMQHGIDVAGNALKATTPQIVDGMLMIERLHGIGNLILTLCFLIIPLCMIVVGFKFQKKSKAEMKMTDYSYQENTLIYTDEGELFRIISYVLFILSLPALLIFIFHIIDIWMWIDIFEPKLGLAHKLLITSGMDL